ncbi:9761_t:CDS:2 [Acaulospora colombiana]|uniref:9761_t:CDS:1 n=1 Tax=Acaulospora colombiana TaxID=27376 RepID=A0ACA9KLN0_9GLOM|nr:9761_t:CDS:2 [Acaulospora colombiana]
MKCKSLEKSSSGIMFFSETLLQEPSDKQATRTWSEVSSSRFKSRRSKHPRKKQRTSSQEYDDLLVFGYEVKTFRDDEMSKKVDDGNFLISWRGETENKILLDRYDVRNLLDDREQFKKVSYTMSRRNEDIEQEKIIDEERWKDLDSESEDLFEMSEEERDVYIEEKREKRTVGENKGYSYHYQYAEESQSHDDEAEETSKPLDNRVDEIIERTAKFLNASTDPQMEIVIQAKQASNPSFSFLNKEDPLYPYYKHVRVLLQTGLFAYGGDDEDGGGSSGEEKKASSADDESEGDESATVKDNKKRRRTNESISSNVKSGNSIYAQNNNQTSSGTSKTPQQKYCVVVVPPPDLKAIIDKMSAYVAKNGQSLEAKVREKHIDDPRFSFLLPWNEFHPYYKKKIQDEKSTFDSAENASAKTSDS